MAGKQKGSIHTKDRLTAAGVAAFKLPGRYPDGGGVFLQVDASGSKRWIQRIMFRGRRHDIGLGPIDLVSLADARKAAKVNKELTRKGVDPLAEKERAKGIPTFSEAAKLVIEIKAKGLKNAKHVDQWRNTLATYAEPVFGHRRVNEIDQQDVVRALQPIWVEKTETANRLRGRIEAILDWATVSKFRAGDNPARWNGNLEFLLPAPSKVAKKAHHPSVRVAEMPRWWRDVSRRPGMASKALRFVALTWARSGEVRGMTWDEVDLEGARWDVPAERMKAKKAYCAPLTADAVALLQSLPRTSSPYVFPADRGGMLSDMALSMLMRRVNDIAEGDAMAGGYFDPINGKPAVPHGLRSTARSWAAKRGYDHDMAEMQLAHDVGTKVQRAYQRDDMIERRRAMLHDWTDFITGRKSGRVVALKSAS